MIRKRVNSSNLQSIGYDPKSKTLEIEFHSGGIYQYSNVPTSIYDALMSASSRGSFFQNNIRDRFRYRKIR